MKYLNLTKGFNPYNAQDSDCIQFESFTFSGGEPHIKIKDKYVGDVTITHRINSFNDVGLLLVVADAIKRIRQPMRDGSKYITNLFIPYLPGARQDRVMVPGEPLTVKVYADIINSMNFDSVTIFDPHSDVTPALLNNCEVINNCEFVIHTLNSFDTLEDKILISPDGGAIKKTYELNTQLLMSWVQAGKHRDPRDGKISCFTVNTDNLQGKDCVICDDICDGGGTFIGLAKELKKKNAGDIYLVVSHGIFSKPLKELKPYFKKIYTTDSWRSEFCWEQQERDCTDLVEIIKFKDFL